MDFPLTSQRTAQKKKFTGNFWSSLTQQLGVKHIATSAYYPQGNGQIERLNQTIETYLRAYVNNQNKTTGPNSYPSPNLLLTTRSTRQLVFHQTKLSLKFPMVYDPQ